MRGNSLAVGFVVLAVVFVLLAGLYYEGVLQIFVTDPHAKHHTTHAILFGVLAIASLIAANFARSKRTA
jgi:ABC-type thiamin/hydroxymethylpyrimidine transport system permease subunit